jgi:surface polysaccharide O-acyltransferase-like enzyme
MGDTGAAAFMAGDGKEMKDSGIFCGILFESEGIDKAGNLCYYYCGVFIMVGKTVRKNGWEAHMKKKLLVALVVTVLVFSLAMPAFACSVRYDRSRSEAIKLYTMVKVANAKIEAAVLVAQKTPRDDVKQLLALIDKIVNPVYAYADSIGATVECVEVDYYIDGQWVAIDPLRVVNVGTGGTN